MFEKPEKRERSDHEYLAVNELKLKNQEKKSPEMTKNDLQVKHFDKESDASNTRKVSKKKTIKIPSKSDRPTVESIQKKLA
jgi:hypothetical protein